MGSSALAVYGGTVWIACLLGGLFLGAAIDDAPDDGTSQGGSHGLADALPEIVMSTVVLLVLAYGLFAWLLSRQPDAS